MTDLFEKGNNYFLEFEKGSNCLFGDNGTGKTTIIDLIVSSLSCNLATIMKINFSQIAITILDHNGKDKVIDVYKSKPNSADPFDNNYDLFSDQNEISNKKFVDINSDPWIQKEIKKSEELSPIKIIYVLGDEDFTFEFPEDEAQKFYLKKIYKSRMHLSVINRLKSLIDITHVPLLRVHQDDEYFEKLIEQRYKSHPYYGDYERINFADTSYLVLRDIESKFKKIAKDYHSIDTKKLEEFKSKIIQNFLVKQSDIYDLQQFKKERKDQGKIANIF